MAPARSRVRVAWFPRSRKPDHPRFAATEKSCVRKDGSRMMRATHEQIRNRAKVRDEGSRVILLLVMLASIASLVAIVLELAAETVSTVVSTMSRNEIK